MHCGPLLPPRWSISWTSPDEDLREDEPDVVTPALGTVPRQELPAVPAKAGVKLVAVVGSWGSGRRLR